MNKVWFMVITIMVSGIVIAQTNQNQQPSTSPPIGAAPFSGENPAEAQKQVVDQAKQAAEDAANKNKPNPTPKFTPVIPDPNVNTNVTNKGTDSNTNTNKNTNDKTSDTNSDTNTGQTPSMNKGAENPEKQDYIRGY